MRLEGARVGLASMVAAALLGASLTVVWAAPNAVGATPPARVADRSACPAGPFTADFAAFLASRWPGHPFTVAVHDTRTGCDFDFRPDLRLTTASVLKAEIMAGVLLRAQRAGRELTAAEDAAIRPMITESDDVAAGDLWRSLGGVAGMQAVDQAFGLTETVQTSPWGLTRTSAADRTRLQRQLLLGEYGPLDAHFQAIARSYMLAVIPSQRWGLTAGVPATWAVPLKNGFFPSTCCAWRVNSSGVVDRPDGTAYAATILSDGWRTEAEGIAAVELIARVVAATLAAPAPPFASAAAFVARQFQDLFGRAPTFVQWYAATQAIGPEGLGGPTLVAGLLGSAGVDATDLTVLRLYRMVPGHAPDPATFRRRAWQVRTGRLDAGGLAAALVASPAFTVLDDAEFVTRILTAALGRPPTDAERAGAGALLAAGATRGALVAAVVGRADVRHHLGPAVAVDEVHLVLLRRRPTAAEASADGAALAAGHRLVDIVATVLGSSEYARRIG